MGAKTVEASPPAVGSPTSTPGFLADTTGGGSLDIVGCHDNGLWVSLQDEEGVFAEPLYVLDDFGVDQGWSSIDEHPRFVVKTTGDGVPDIVGFGGPGVHVVRNLFRHFRTR